MGWWVLNKAFREITLDAGDEVVIFCVLPFRDNPKSVILQDRRARDSSEEALLHTSFEADDSYFR